MIQINGWLVIIPTYLDEDVHTKINEEAIYSQVDSIVADLKYNDMQVITKNGIKTINMFLCTNHKTMEAENSIIALEHGSVYGSKLAGLHELRAFAAAGAFDKAKAIITGPLDEDNEETILQVICKEVHRPDMVILENVDYIHRTPMTILPTGALMEIDCDAPEINILESGVL